MDEIERLIQQLEDPSRKVRIAAARALGRIGPEAKSALTGLEFHFCAATDPAEVKALIAAIGLIDPIKVDWVWESRNLRRDGESCRELARTLDAQQATQAVRELIGELENGTADESLRNPFLYLVALGMEVPAVIPELLGLMNNPKVDREMTCAILERVAEKQPQLGEAVVPFLANDNPSKIDLAAAIICQAKCVGEKVQEAIALLIERCGVDDDSSTAAYALQDLAEAKYAREVVDAVVKEIRAERGGKFGGRMFDVLSKIAGPGGVPEARTAFVLLLRDARVTIRRGAAAFAPDVDSPEVGSALCEVMQDPDEIVRRSAVNGRIRYSDGWGADLVPYLIVAMDDASLPIRWEAVKRLGTLGPAAAAALPVLRAKRAKVKEDLAALQDQCKVAKALMAAAKAKYKQEQKQLPGEYKAAIATMVDLRAFCQRMKKAIQEIGEAIRKIESAPAGQ